MRGWSREPVVREILEMLSRVNGAHLMAIEQGAGSQRAGAVPNRAMLREITVGNSAVGWIAIEDDRNVTGGAAMLDQAAAVVSAQVSSLGELESLSGEIADRYEELNLLYNLSDTLGSLRDAREICGAVLDQALRVIGGMRGAILLLDDDRQLLSLVAHRNLDARSAMTTSFAPGDGISGYVLTTGRALVVDDAARLPAELCVAGRPADQHLVEPPLLSVPMKTRDRTIGVIHMSKKALGGPFTSQDLKLAQALASQAAVFIEIDRFITKVRDGERLQSELEIARKIQQGMLPRREPVIPGMQVAGMCRPASHVGGDYYGFIEEAAPGMTGLAIIDVSGHSVGAAVCMASTRSILRCEAAARRSTREVVERVNDLVCEDLEEGGMYATLVYALYDHAAGDLRYTNAGHPPPLMLKSGEQRCRRLTMGGMGVGISPRQGYREETVRMTADDVLLLYTDGLTEAPSPGGEMFGEARLAQAMGRHRQATAWEIVTALLDEISAFVGGAPQVDDIAIILMKATMTSSRNPGGSAR